MNNIEIARVFDAVADLLEFKGANPFRVRAYRSGAATIRDLPESARNIVEDPERQLTDLVGIGKDLQEKVNTLLRTSSLPLLRELLEQVPETVLALMRVPGLGPKKSLVLFKELDITSLDGLRKACETGRVRNLKGFGSKTEKALLEGLEIATKAGQRIYWSEAEVVVEQLLSHMKQSPLVRQVEVVGSYRRKCETIGNVNLLVEATNASGVMRHLEGFSEMAHVLAHGETKMLVQLIRGLQIDLRVVTTESFGSAVQYFTGSKEHNVVLRRLAKLRSLKINQLGVFRVTNNQENYLAGHREEEVYAALDLPCFPPELREARQEFDWATQGSLPALVERTDILGDLHMHTSATDGLATLEEMVAAARSRGLSYIAITDHSQRVTMARGLDAKRLRQQWKSIDRMRVDLSGFQILKGIECDILERGGLDLPDDVLAEADWVVASIHYGQKQSEQQITERMLEALEHPHVSAIAHPTGRLINRRRPYAIDLETVFRAAAHYGKFMELNANPARLDLNDVACAQAKRHHVPVVINSDAHSTDGLNVIRYGIWQARRGGLTKADVANTRPWEQLQSYY